MKFLNSFEIWWEPFGLWWNCWSNFVKADLYLSRGVSWDHDCFFFEKIVKLFWTLSEKLSLLASFSAVSLNFDSAFRRNLFQWKSFFCKIVSIVVSSGTFWAKIPCSEETITLSLLSDLELNKFGRLAEKLGTGLITLHPTGRVELIQGKVFLKNVSISSFLRTPSKISLDAWRNYFCNVETAAF